MTTTNEPNESVDSLKTAAGYSKSANLLMKYVGKTRSEDVLASMIVLRSLALEIYLKHLYAVEYQRPYEGRHFKQIFDALSAETRRRITDHYNRSLAESGFAKQVLAKHQEIKKEVPKLDLEHVLQEWADAMTDLRYFYEPRHNVVFLTFGEIENALLQSLRDISVHTGPGSEQRSAA